MHLRAADVKNASSGYEMCTQMLLYFTLLVEEKHFNSRVERSRFAEERIDWRVYIFETLKWDLALYLALSYECARLDLMGYSSGINLTDYRFPRHYVYATAYSKRVIYARMIRD